MAPHLKHQRRLKQLKIQIVGGSIECHPSNFKSIPGSPIAYTASSRVLNIFGKSSIADIANVRLGMATADNDKFLRLWFEKLLFTNPALNVIPEKLHARNKS